MGKGKIMLQKHNAKASVLASMIVAAGTYVAGAVDALTVDYANIDGGDLKPKLTWAGTTAVDIERAEGSQDSWTKMDTVSAGTTTWTDSSTVVSKTYWYRLNDNGDTSAAQKFIAVRKLNTSSATVVYEGDFTSENWCKSPALAFDGKYGTGDDGKDSYPDSTTSYPKVGLDFGSAVYHVAFGRAYPRTTDNQQGRLNGLVLYGIDGDTGFTTDGTTWNATGTALSTALSGVSENKWHYFDVDPTSAYRVFYYSGATGGNVNELELYGWDVPYEPESAVCPGADNDWYFRGEYNHMSFVFNERYAATQPRNVAVGTKESGGFGRTPGLNDPFSYVVWNAAPSSDISVTNGLAGAGPLRIAHWEEGDPAVGHNFGALKVESGDYSFSGINVGETGVGYFWVAGGRVYSSEDVCLSMSAGGSAIVGQDSGDPAVLNVAANKWLYVSKNEKTPGSLVIKSTGTVVTPHLHAQHPEGSSVALDGGTIVRNGDTPSEKHELTAATLPLTLTSKGGTIKADVQATILSDIIGEGVLTKTGASEFYIGGDVDEDVGLKISEGNVRIASGLQFKSIEIAEGCKLIVDFSNDGVDGMSTYSPVAAGGTFSMPDGATLTDYIDVVGAAGSYNYTLELKNDIPVFSIEAVPGSAEAKIGDKIFHRLAKAAEDATEDQTVELLKDCLLFNAVTFTGANVTLDMAGHTVKRSAGGGCISFSQGGVVSNGTFTTMLGRETMGDSLLAVGDGKSLLVEDVTIGSEGSELYNVFYARKQSTITVRDVTCYATTLFSCYYKNNDVGVFEVKSGDFHFRAWKVRNGDYMNGKVQLSGGSYSLKPLIDYVKDGSVILHTPSNTELPFSVVPSNTSGLYKVSSPAGDVYAIYYLSQAEAEAAYVAYVKGAEANEYYTMISVAVASAPDNGTVEVIADVLDLPEMIQVTGGKSVTVNGNGHLVKVSKPFVDESGYVGSDYVLEHDAVFMVWNGCELTLRDIHIMGGGKVKPESDNSTVNFAITNHGHLMLDNVTITRSNGAVFNGGAGYLYMNNCRLVRNCRYCAGGLFNYGFAVLNRTSLSENRSLSSGGGGGATENGHFMYLNNCVLCNNSSTEIGGAINNFHSGQEVRLYLMNTTISGNFGSSGAYDYGGGIGLRAAANPGSFYGVNSIICNNYQNQIANGTETIRKSDITALDNDLKGNDWMTNSMHYCVYDNIHMSGTQDVVWEIGENYGNKWHASENVNLFNDYYSSVRVYQNAKITVGTINGAQLVSKDDGSLNADLARYAPIKKNGDAIFGEDGVEGVLTYFDASDWKNGVVKMSYRTQNGKMTALGNLEAASESDIVTNFYERAYGRTIGIAGASGLLESEIEYHTVRLSEEPKNGTATGITLYGDSYPDGTEVTVVAQPNFACSFLGWYAADGTTLISSSAVYSFVVQNDVAMFPKFSEPAATVSYVVTARQGDEDADFPITVSTTWLNEYVSTDTAVLEDKTAVKNILNAVDPENGLKKWHEYVLGFTPGDRNAKIWINSPQLWDETKIRMKMNELAPTKGTGFTVKYLLGTKAQSAESFSDGDYSATSTFDVPVDTDPTGLYRISLAFIPDGCDTSNERVVTVNTAGVLKVTASAKKLPIAVPWVAFSPTNSSPISAANLVKTMNLTPGDRLHVYDGDGTGTYKSWQLREGGAWEPLGTYAIDSNGNINWDSSGMPTATTVPRGAGAWLERQNTSTPVYVVGQLDETNVTTPLTDGWNLVGSPTGAQFNISVFTTPKTGDRIVIPTGTEPKNCTFEDGKWGYNVTSVINYGGLSFTKTVRKTEDLVVPVGTAFWYISKGAGEIQW
jgi:hypothetical protein